MRGPGLVAVMAAHNRTICNTVMRRVSCWIAQLVDSVFPVAPAQARPAQRSAD